MKAHLTEEEKKQALELLKKIDENRLQKKFSQYFKELMFLLDMNDAKEIAKKLGISHQTVYRWWYDKNPMQYAKVVHLRSIVEELAKQPEARFSAGVKDKNDGNNLRFLIIEFE